MLRQFEQVDSRRLVVAIRLSFQPAARRHIGIEKAIILQVEGRIPDPARIIHPVPLPPGVVDGKPRPVQRYPMTRRVPDPLMME